MLDFERLRIVALRVIADPRWTGQVAHVVRTDHPGVNGKAVGNVVSFARFAPYCTVPHELAHVLARTGTHGKAWSDAFELIVSWLDEENNARARAHLEYARLLLLAEVQRYR